MREGTANVSAVTSHALWRQYIDAATQRIFERSPQAAGRNRPGSSGAVELIRGLIVYACIPPGMYGCSAAFASTGVPCGQVRWGN